MAHGNAPPSPFQCIVAGAAAGGVESLVTYPVEYVKTRKQRLSSSESAVKILATAVWTSGPTVLYTRANQDCRGQGGRQTVQVKSTRHAVQSILAADGVSGLFRGPLPVTSKQGPNALVRFTSYNALLDVQTHNAEA
ncbi:hypothetical protein Cob_v012771 [Colletotrichum orbiculare MAFF 240422]|uniref:Mitochondrial carrier n=1 Tax=Colletotrichum orbiculare (strain 104-T / ATCC 96160 / CBS 514.97 / LARS 414 / MAFF 240422) TaxID=1213857 RepID=A0A484F8Q2_COLOR|nr:hypothetical protein Cob_v012771 [Colletotrichum orbiculare MAFF 240422]